MVLRALPVSISDEIEVVEHKGLGHPDTICDALAEELSRALGRFYLERFGAVLHHNVDKALLCAGVARPRFGGGDVLAPMELFLAGRATTEVRGVAVPVADLARESACAWIRAHLHALDPDRHVVHHCLVRPGSAELVELFLRHADTRVWLANDTSFGVGYAPASDLERVVLAVARRLRELAANPTTPEVGEDVKIMGVRRERRIELTVACAFIARFVRDLEHYVELRTRLAEHVAAAAHAVTASEVVVEVNAADDAAKSSVYLTVTGTSAEAGDDGQVGRGNRVNGLITPYRPMTLEAAAGKNPVSHVGKIYNLAAHDLAQRLVDSVPGIGAAECLLVSRIGCRIDEPRLTDVRVRLCDGVALADVRARVTEIVHHELRELPNLWRRVLRGEIAVY